MWETKGRMMVLTVVPSVGGGLMRVSLGLRINEGTWQIRSMHKVSILWLHTCDLSQ